MISVTTILLQALGAVLIAVFIVWSTYTTYRVLIPNNRWFKSLSLLPNPLNMGIRAFIVFEAMFLIGDAIWVVEPSIHKLYFYSLSQLGLQGTQVGIGMLVILLGLGAYWFKVRNQGTYGFVEIIFAGALGVATAKQMTATTQLAGPVAALIGAVYVVSRGAGNIADSWKKS